MYKEETIQDEAYIQFTQDFEKLSGISLYKYKEKQMKRRIGTYMERKRIAGYEEFINFLRGDEHALHDFTEYITINVTEFFRTPVQWEIFEESVLDKLADSSAGGIKIWSCASSSGEEPYSVAMSILKHNEAADFHILATDIDEEVLRKAVNGVYSEEAVKDVPQALKDKYFTVKGRRYAINKEVKEHVEFAKLDLLNEDYPKECDLIVCRNVVIYFKDEAKDDMYRKFYSALKSGGHLFTGNTEQIIYYKKYGYKRLTKFLYEK